MENPDNSYILDHWKKTPKIEKTGLNIPIKVSLPARFDLIGGWTDTPPYYFDNPAAVLNSTLTIDGDATSEKAEREIIVSVENSGQLNITENCSENISVQDNIIIKTVFEITGIKNEKISLKISNRIPHGSGLGGSSLLASSILAALWGYYNGAEFVEKNIKGLVNNVLLIEQLMGSGGGWQDQIGGGIPGIKLIETIPENNCGYNISYINNENTIDELNSRSLLIDSLIQRKAARILYSIRQKYVERDKKTVETLKNIRNCAVKGFELLENCGIDSFAGLLTECWERVNEIESGSIEFVNILKGLCGGDLSGYKIGGAGGGGFILAIFKDREKKEFYKDKINNNYSNCRVYSPIFGVDGMILEQENKKIRITRMEKI